MNKKEDSFEKAFERLEDILKILNEEKVSLKESLKLFEEADSLITDCSEKLNSAEQKIEILIKKRNNLELDLDNNPKKELFSPKLQTDNE
ncbi:MAG: hypothetical protein AMS24_02865 [Chlamydiae bacterium SM23_39]|nr:MAG: hypothetical protein AMS24_02865 [Chlamydiae bacterium SM23_39]